MYNSFSLYYFLLVDCTFRVCVCVLLLVYTQQSSTHNLFIENWLIAFLRKRLHVIPHGIVKCNNVMNVIRLKRIHQENLFCSFGDANLESSVELR